jgi:hypothetical protein
MIYCENGIIEMCGTADVLMADILSSIDALTDKIANNGIDKRTIVSLLDTLTNVMNEEIRAKYVDSDNAKSDNITIKVIENDKEVGK